MVLYEQTLIDTLRQKCDNAKRRIWIASPFIGAIKDIHKIIGGKWMLPSIDCRILTDIEAGFIRKDSIEEFTNYQIQIKSLFGLHAKVYIVDDWCLVTSANLTGTAFLCRYEMGISLDEVKDVESRFLKWWGQAKKVTRIPQKPNQAIVDYQDGKHFPRKFKAPTYKTREQDKYEAACEQYIGFARLYEGLTGRNKQMVKDGYTLLQEVDFLFNYLYHDHPNTPSHNQNEQRSLSPKQREKEILRYFKDMSAWYKLNPQNGRFERTSTIQTLLSPSHIDSLSWDDVSKVANCLHCFKGYPPNMKKFLDPANNDLQTIKGSWKSLLHTGLITQQKIERVLDALKYFGPSCVRELIGWYYPDKYPLMNSNSDCGMRFFGYNI